MTQKTMIKLILYALLAVSAVGAYYGWTNLKKGFAWAQPLTIICAILASISGLWVACLTSFSNGYSEVAQTREEAYMQISAQKLSELICEQCPGKKAIVLIDPYLEYDHLSPHLKGLQIGLKNTVEIVKVVRLKAPGAPDGIHPIDKPLFPAAPDAWLTPKALETQLADIDFDVCITLVGLPTATRVQGKNLNIKVFNGKNVYICSGITYPHRLAIQSGAVSGAVCVKIDAIIDGAPIPKDLDTAFNKRYALVTSANINQYRKLFK